MKEQRHCARQLKEGLGNLPKSDSAAVETFLARLELVDDTLGTNHAGSEPLPDSWAQSIDLLCLPVAAGQVGVKGSAAGPVCNSNDPMATSPVARKWGDVNGVLRVATALLAPLVHVRGGGNAVERWAWTGGRHRRNCVELNLHT